MSQLFVGGTCLGQALWFRRRFRAGEARVRRLHHRPLFDNANWTVVIESVMAMASLAPPARAAAEQAIFRGEGGGLAGGGSSGSY